MVTLSFSAPITRVSAFISLSEENVSAFFAAPIFGVFAGPNSAIEVIQSLLGVDFNRGIAVAGYFAWRNQPVEYDEEYTPKPKLLDGFVLDDTKQVFGLYSIFAVDGNGEAGFHVLETVFDLSSVNMPATNVYVDNR